MPLTYEIDPLAAHAQATAVGVVSMTAMIDVIERMAADPRYRTHFTIIFDLRVASYTAELSDGDALAAVLRQKKTDYQNRFAVVVGESLHLLARLYCLLANMAGFQLIRCFADMDEAQAWVRATRGRVGPGGCSP